MLLQLLSLCLLAVHIYGLSLREALLYHCFGCSFSHPFFDTPRVQALLAGGFVVYQSVALAVSLFAWFLTVYIYKLSLQEVCCILDCCFHCRLSAWQLSVYIYRLSRWEALLYLRLLLWLYVESSLVWLLTVYIYRLSLWEPLSLFGHQAFC